MMRESRRLFAATAGRASGPLFMQGGLAYPYRDQWEWECPWCDHSIMFPFQDRHAAEAVARAHVLGKHGPRLWTDVIDTLETLRGSHGGRRSFG